MVLCVRALFRSHLYDFCHLCYTTYTINYLICFFK